MQSPSKGQEISEGSFGAFNLNRKFLKIPNLCPSICSEKISGFVLEN